MKASLETSVRVICPSCGNPAWLIDPAHEIGRRYDWSGCENCGARYHLTILEDGVELEPQAAKDIPAWLIVKLAEVEPPIYFVTSSPIYHREQGDTPDEREQHNRYWIEESTCPTNIVPVDAIVTEDDDDPHGILEFVAHVPKADPQEDEPEDGWLDLIGRVTGRFIEGTGARVEVPRLPEPPHQLKP